MEVPFLFQQQNQRIGNALGVSVVTHIAVLGLLFLISQIVPDKVYQAVLPDTLPDIVWLADPGPGGGGGGGGNRSPEPPKKVELPGKQEISVPTPPPKPVEMPKPEPEPMPEINIPAQTAAAAPVIAPGAREQSGQHRIPGRGRGRWRRHGHAAPASAREPAPGLGQGSGGGTGGGVFRPGNGVTIPRVLREVKPAYTAEAMRAKVQGVVMLECVVMPDGSIGRVEVVKSLDGTFGLDQEAIKAARQWRFAPGTRFGEPVAVLVTIELAFTLR